jgi:hypothetical protein
MSYQYSRFLSTNRTKDERRRRKEEISAAFVITIMPMIALRYNRRRPRHIVDPNEELERRVQERKQMLRNIYRVQISTVITVCAYQRHHFMTYVPS